jgi:hypothetical protein
MQGRIDGVQQRARRIIAGIFPEHHPGETMIKHILGFEIERYVLFLFSVFKARLVKIVRQARALRSDFS